MRFLSNRFAYFIPTSCSTISKRQLFLTCVLPFSFCAMAQAHPLDSPEIVYIDGLPCNSACQSYMVWSRKTLNQGRAGSEHRATRSASPVAHGEGSAAERPKSTARANVARSVVPLPREAPQQRMASLPRADETLAPDAAAATPGVPTAVIDQAPTAQVTPPEQVSAMKPSEEKVAAVATSAIQAQQGASVESASPRVERSEPKDAERAALPPGRPASLALAVPEIKPPSNSVDSAVAAAPAQITLPVTFSPPPPAMTNRTSESDSSPAHALAWLTGLRHLFSSF